MRQRVKPLPEGTVIQDRFEITSVLGQGGFGIAYLGHDNLRKEDVVIKELAPDGITRNEHGCILLEELGRSTAHRLRQQFLDEARSLSRLNLPGVPKIRATAVENGTVYYFTEHYAKARTAADWVSAFGPLDESDAAKIIVSLAETLAAVHEKGILHRDIKPENILLRQGHPPVIIDFGAAREWHADKTVSQTAVFTPGYAPLEMYSESGMRGPATDVFGLAASAYFLIMGFPPVPVVDRLNGVPLVPPMPHGGQTQTLFSEAVVKGLALRFEDRPASMHEFIGLIRTGSFDAKSLTLEEIDEKLMLLKKLSPRKRQCPVCSEIMTEPKPLRRDECPVCRRGTIKKRVLNDHTCPACRIGVLKAFDNQSHPVICPICSKHKLHKHTRGFIRRTEERCCKGCGAVLSSASDIWTLADNPPDPDRVGETREWPDWRTLSGRSEKVMICDSCEAVYDIQADNRWKQIEPQPEKGKYDVLYPEEWARAAANLDPGCGTHACVACEADYYIDDATFTLLAAFEDPYGFAEKFLGRHLSPEQSRWVGSGKMSPHPGPTCTACGTEFDAEGTQWRLIRTSSCLLKSHTDELKDPVDWHRLATGIPCQSDEENFLLEAEAAIRRAYFEGEMDLDGKGTIWRGAASRIGGNEESSVLVGCDTELSFGPLLRKVRIGMEDVSSIDCRDSLLLLTFYDPEKDPIQFSLEPIELTAKLNSGDRTITLTADDLARRLGRILEHLVLQETETSIS